MRQTEKKKKKSYTKKIPWRHRKTLNHTDASCTVKVRLNEQTEKKKSQVSVPHEKKKKKTDFGD